VPEASRRLCVGLRRLCQRCPVPPPRRGLDRLITSRTGPITSELLHDRLWRSDLAPRTPPASVSSLRERRPLSQLLPHTLAMLSPSARRTSCERDDGSTQLSRVTSAPHSSSVLCVGASLLWYRNGSDSVIRLPITLRLLVRSCHSSLSGPDKKVITTGGSTPMLHATPPARTCCGPFLDI
jgi:hypothetical protein